MDAPSRSGAVASGSWGIWVALSLAINRSGHAFGGWLAVGKRSLEPATQEPYHAEGLSGNAARESALPRQAGFGPDGRPRERLSKGPPSRPARPLAGAVPTLQDYWAVLFFHLCDF